MPESRCQRAGLSIGADFLKAKEGGIRATSNRKFDILQSKMISLKGLPACKSQDLEAGLLSRTSKQDFETRPERPF